MSKHFHHFESQNARLMHDSPFAQLGTLLLFLKCC
jgi:hypothetical protein